MDMLLTAITRIEDLTGISVKQYLYFQIDKKDYNAQEIRYSSSPDAQQIGWHSGSSMHTGIKIKGGYIEMGYWEAHRRDDCDGNYIVIDENGTLTLGCAIASYEHSRYGSISRKEKKYSTAPFYLSHS